MVVVGFQQDAPVRRVGRVERAQIGPVERALEHAERERSPWQRLEVTVGQEPPDEVGPKAERGGVPVNPDECRHGVEHGI